MSATTRRDFLETEAADVLCVALFAAAGVVLAERLLLAAFLPPVLRAGIAVAVTLLGPIGCGVERGRERRLSWGLALGLSAVGAAVHLGVLVGLRPVAAPAIAEACGRGAALLALGPAAARFAARFDRGERGWRAAVRKGPPDGTSPLGLRIAAARAPGWISWPLLPLSLAGRAAALLTIRAYQLTASRLMPPACRFEPTCSRYGYGVYRTHGCVKGTLLTALRIVRCSELSPGGHDPVPPGARRRGLSCPSDPAAGGAGAPESEAAEGSDEPSAGRAERVG